MTNLRKYGNAPFEVAVIHGGPGAPGEVAPIAKVLSSKKGVLEPIQTAKSVDGQVDELKELLEKEGDTPITLIGYSWGAWLAFILAARHQNLVKKLILISSGPFEKKYAANIMKTRIRHLNTEEKNEFHSLIEKLNTPDTKDDQNIVKLFGKLISKADSYDPVPYDDEAIELQLDVFRSVWPQAERLRESGELLEMGKEIRCPVVAIHGDYDPHPYEGVKEPLSHTLTDFRLILLKNCGHHPWLEKRAKDKFYDVLRDEL
ncbi:MAG: alpha/beta hydrolase [Pseudomonadota bacterium]